MPSSFIWAHESEIKMRSYKNKEREQYNLIFFHFVQIGFFDDPGSVNGVDGGG